MEHQQHNRQHDDAPVTASRTAEPARALFAESVTIVRPSRELYEFWRDQTKLAQVMENVVSIERIDDRRFRWTVRAPLGREVSWEAVVTDDVPGESITWQSAEDADVQNSGKIEFRDAGRRGTIVRATIAYKPPAGAVGKIVAKLFQREPRIQTRRDLHRFKQLMEAGEIATSARTKAERENRNEDQQAEHAA